MSGGRHVLKRAVRVAAGSQCQFRMWTQRDCTLESVSLDVEEPGLYIDTVVIGTDYQAAYSNRPRRVQAGVCVTVMLANEGASDVTAIVRGTFDFVGPNLSLPFQPSKLPLQPTVTDACVPADCSPPVREEVHCRGCGKPNDRGVRTCWCCGGSPE